MRFHAYVLAAAMAAPILAASAPARAQQPVHDEARAAMPPKPEVPDFIDPQQFFARSRVLGDAWSRAVGAVIDTMKRLVDAERVAARQTLAPPPQRQIPWQLTPAPWRETPATTRVVAFGPMPVQPVTESAYDTRGERAALLGAQVTMPWMVP
jgi:hypothetical protein